MTIELRINSRAPYGKDTVSSASTRIMEQIPSGDGRLESVVAINSVAFEKAEQLVAIALVGFRLSTGSLPQNARTRQPNGGQMRNRPLGILVNVRLLFAIRVSYARGFLVYCDSRRSGWSATQFGCAGG